jgi:hypothetical protein
LSDMARTQTTGFAAKQAIAGVIFSNGYLVCFRRTSKQTGFALRVQPTRNGATTEPKWPKSTAIGSLGASQSSAYKKQHFGFIGGLGEVTTG